MELHSNSSIPYKTSNIEPKSADVTVKKISEIDQTIARKAIQKINSSVHWSHYDSTIIQNYFNENLILFAIKDDEVIGYVAFTEYNKNQKLKYPHLYISYIAVESQKQGKEGGFAAMKMMRAVLETARIAKAAKVILNYRGTNQKTKAFYNKVGKLENLEVKDKEKGIYSEGIPRKKFTYHLHSNRTQKITQSTFSSPSSTIQSEEEFISAFRSAENDINRALEIKDHIGKTSTTSFATLAEKIPHIEEFFKLYNDLIKSYRILISKRTHFNSSVDFSNLGSFVRSSSVREITENFCSIFAHLIFNESDTNELLGVLDILKQAPNCSAAFAKQLAKDPHFLISEFINEFNILDKKNLIDIAKLSIQNKGTEN